MSSKDPLFLTYYVHATITELQSWTKLVETNTNNAHISQFSLHGNTDKITEMLSLPPPPSPQSMLFGRTEDSSGGFWRQSNIDKEEMGKDLLW